jgi:hypothetical protein
MFGRSATELGHRVSDRQWGDVVGVLNVQGDTLDRDYLDFWAHSLGVSELLRLARQPDDDQKA